ncbi:hypothetical protein M8494_27375 [Serratia ureilytica]
MTESEAELFALQMLQSSVVTAILQFNLVGSFAQFDQVLVSMVIAIPAPFRLTGNSQQFLSVRSEVR